MSFRPYRIISQTLARGLVYLNAIFAIPKFYISILGLLTGTLLEYEEPLRVYSYDIIDRNRYHSQKSNNDIKKKGGRGRN